MDEAVDSRFVDDDRVVGTSMQKSKKEKRPQKHSKPVRPAQVVSSSRVGAIKDLYLLK